MALLRHYGNTVQRLIKALLLHDESKGCTTRERARKHEGYTVR